ncbi:MAG: AsmA-like C-terminal region-containing protein [Betaproteobacteria bacterium]
MGLSDNRRMAGSLYNYTSRFLSKLLIQSGKILSLTLIKISLKLIIGIVLTSLLLSQVILRFLIWPQINSHQDEIQNYLSKTLQVNVSIHKLNASWDNFRPSIEIESLKFTSPEQNSTFTQPPLLFAPKIKATFGWDSLWTGIPRFYKLEADNINASILHNPKGEWFIAGIQTRQTGNSGELLRWALSENNLSTKNLTLHVLDEFEKTSTTDVIIKNFNLKNDELEHYFNMALETNLTNDSLNLEARFEHKFASDRANWQNWKGNFSWGLNTDDLGTLLRLTNLPLRGSSGKLDSTGEFILNRGGFTNGKALLHAENLQLLWEQTQNHLNLKKVNVHLIQSSKNKMQYIEADQFEWQFAQDGPKGIANSISKLQIGFTPPEHGKGIQNISLIAPQVKLKPLSQLLLGLPLAQPYLNQLAELEPEGQLDDFYAQWSDKSASAAPLGMFGKKHPELIMRAKIDNVGWSETSTGIPGIRGISGDLSSTPTEGSFKLNSNNFAISSQKHIGSTKLTFNQADGIYAWGKIQDQWQLKGHEIKFKNDAINFSSDIELLISNQYTPQNLKLSLDINEGNIAEIVKYIPAKNKLEFLTYIKATAQSGKIQNSKVFIQGNPQHIPFSKSFPGKFSLQLNIKDAIYRPLPNQDKSKGEWNNFEKVNAQVNMENHLLEISIPTANYKNASLKDVLVKSELNTKNPSFIIEGDSSGSLQDLFSYILASPLAKDYQESFKDLAFSGNQISHLKLTQELSGKQSTQFKTEMNLNGNSIEFKGLPIGTIQAGKIIATEVGIKAVDLGGIFLGGNFKLFNPTNNSRIKLNGSAELKQVLDFVSTIGSETLNLSKNNGRGTIAYQAEFGAAENNSYLRGTVDMRQADINLPLPLNKSIGIPLLAQIDMSYFNDKVIRTSNWKIKYGDLIQSSGSFKNNLLDHHELSIGNIDLPIAIKGTNVKVQLPELDLDAWTDLFKSQIAQNKSQTESNPNASTMQLTAQVEHLKILNRVFDDVTLDARHKQNEWSAKINSPKNKGDLLWTETNNSLNFGHLVANFDKVSIPPSLGTKQTSQNSVNNALKKLPDLDVSINDLTIDSHPWGELKIKATNLVDSWKIENLSIKNPYANVSSSGSWQLPNENYIGQTRLNFNLAISNAGNLLSSLGYPEVLTGGDGIFKGEIDWLGSPVSFSKQFLSGNLSLNLKNGKILQVDPGAAKLLGILSFQNLFKFATFNIKGSLGEAVSSGTYFDQIAGDAKLNRGVATTESFEMQSTIAKVSMRGRINLANETQDLRITIFPRINLGSAALGAFYFVSPIIGVSTLIGQYLLSSGVNKVLQTDYLVQGNWKEPEVIPLDQKGNPLDPEIIKNIRSKALLTEPAEKTKPLPNAELPEKP